MKLKSLFVMSALLSGAAHSATVAVLNTSLPAVNGTFGTTNPNIVTASTTTTLTGTRTVVTSTAQTNQTANANAITDQWLQRNVRTGTAGTTVGTTTVGITTDYARSGNGSAYFASTSGTSKADLEIYFSTPISASNVLGMGFDWYRDGTSTTGVQFHPYMKLIVSGTNLQTNAAISGYLVYERAYNGFNTTAPTNVWSTQSWTYTTGNLWSTGTLPNAFSTTLNRQLDDWNALVGNLKVTGLSIGIGSGWNGSFKGAIDNVVLNTTTSSTTWNFEVLTASPVPVPGTGVLASLGLFALCAGRTRRRSIS